MTPEESANSAKALSEEGDDSPGTGAGAPENGTSPYGSAPHPRGDDMPSQSGPGLSIRPEKQTRDERRHQEGRAMNASQHLGPRVIPVMTLTVSSVTNFMSECRLFSLSLSRRYTLSP